MLKKFCKYTKIPGYKFIILPHRTRQERIFWIITLITTTISGCIVSYAVIRDNPTKTEIVTDSTHHAVWNFLFPAITICNINKISKSKAYEVARKLKFSNKTIDEIANDFRFLSQLIYYNDNSSETKKKLNDLDFFLEKNNLSDWKLFLDLSPKCNEFLAFCAWKGEAKPCGELFQEIVTSNGVCCTFNYFAPKYPITNRKEYLQKNTPERLSTCGSYTGLSVGLKSNLEDYFVTNIPSSGFTMKVHYPYSMVETNAKQPVYIKNKVDNFVYLTPSLTQVSEYVREMKISQRNCLLSNEKELELSSKYSLRNCVFECKLKLIFKLCGCIPFYYYVEAYYLRNSIYSKNLLSTSTNENSKKICGCLKNCETHIYSTIISVADYHEFGKAPNFTTRVFVTYADVMGYKGTLVTTTTLGGLLAYLGGLFGLFMGLTLVTITECVYFFSVDFIINIYKKYNNRRMTMMVKKTSDKSK